MSDRSPRTEVAATVAAYDAHAQAYAAGLPAADEAHRARLDRFVAMLPARPRVLEVGSGSGRDALLLEGRGVLVQRSDISDGFVRLLRGAGHETWLLDPLADDLGGLWDGVFANASLLHVARQDLPVVLTRLRAATRSGGALALAVKDGKGQGWSTHGRVPAPRHFTYWRESALRSILAFSSWEVRSVDRFAGRKQSGESWLHVTATAAPPGSRCW